MANENRYYKTPFAESGDKTEVPDASVGGAVGYDTGFGPDYELPQGSPGRKRIERDMYNGVLFGTTKNIKQWQEGLYPTWIEDDGTAVAFSYPSGMIVAHAGQNWISKEGSNQEEPGTGIKWAAYEDAVNRSSKISFIFDDAHESAITVLKPLFDTRGYKFGMAIPGANLTTLSRIDYNDMLNLVEDGFEAINHAFTGDAPSTTTYGKMKFIGEVTTAQTRFNRVGVNVVGFVTPSSKLNDIYKDSLSQMVSYGFTEFSSTDPIAKGTSPYNLHRFNMEAETQQVNIDAVDNVANSGGTIVFYAHDVVLNDAQYDKIVAIIDRAEELGVEIVGPTESIKNITKLKEPLLKYLQGDLINNNPSIYSSGDASIVVNNTSDLNITITPASLIRVEATIDLPGSFIGGELLTFCSTLRTISGTFGDASAIGIELKDSGNVIEISDEVSGVELNTNVSRYSISAITLASTAKATVYMLIDSTQAGSVALMRNPLLRLGNDVEAERFTGTSIVGITNNTIPNSTITFGSNQAVTLTDASDNGRFSIASNVLTITSDWTGSIHGSIVGNGGQTVSGGFISWTVGGITGGGGLGGIAAVSPITDAESPTGCASIAASFKIGQTLTLTANARLVDILVSSNTSRITSL